MIVKFRKNIHTIFLLVILSTNFYSANGFCTDRKIEQFSESHGLSESEAKKIMLGTAIIIRTAQRGITEIANDKYSFNEKTKSNGLIDSVIGNSFIGEEAIVHVSSLNRNDNEEYTIKKYLQHLASLSKGKYHNVKIYFNDKIIISNVSRVGDNLKMSADVWQFFEGCTFKEDKQECYRDATKKSFTINYNLNKDDIGSSSAAIEEMGVKDTITFKEAKKLLNDILSFE